MFRPAGAQPRKDEGEHGWPGCSYQHGGGVLYNHAVMRGQCLWRAIPSPLREGVRGWRFGSVLSHPGTAVRQ
ncbi:hypothetical protein SFOMI_0830 [Sphingobium fuliginis]|uniref:Uncharacterized protein n=1 Tax=Sphingobium fuliginis (strain ATCC 27551) TaxID=336203 RepID=A0A292Z9Z6_SPHSA|nr:hypothetical protein SFOMI_0830 [Sphingobium fuliginis]